MITFKIKNIFAHFLYQPLSLYNQNTGFFVSANFRRYSFLPNKMVAKMVTVHYFEWLQK